MKSWSPAPATYDAASRCLCVCKIKNICQGFFEGSCREVGTPGWALLVFLFPSSYNFHTCANQTHVTLCISPQVPEMQLWSRIKVPLSGASCTTEAQLTPQRDLDICRDWAAWQRSLPTSGWLRHQKLLRLRQGENWHRFLNGGLWGRPICSLAIGSPSYMHRPSIYRCCIPSLIAHSHECLGLQSVSFW